MADRRTDDWTKVITYDDICHIARHQIDEIKTLTSNLSPLTSHLYFFDTELITTKVWFDYAFHTVPAWLEEAIRQYPMDIYLLTYPDLPWVPDPARSNGSNAIRMELFERYEAEIQALNIPYYVIQHNEK